MTDDLDDWTDYESRQMFPGCGCGHDATDHKAAWGDWREFDPAWGPDFEGCSRCGCDVEWEHE